MLGCSTMKQQQRERGALAATAAAAETTLSAVTSLAGAA